MLSGPPAVSAQSRGGTARDVADVDGVDAQPVHSDGVRAPHPAILLTLFLAIAIGLTFPNVTRLRTYIAGDSGDSVLNLWIIRRVEIGLPHGWHAFWNAPIFYPAHGTLAYSDTLLPVALVHWPLRLVLGDVLALNVIYLGAWVLSSWCVYCLARRFVSHWGAAFVAALTYTYAASRLIHQAHFQLVVGGALVPLVVLTLLRLFDAPSIGRGVLFGLSFTAVTLSASYFGAMLAVVVLIVGGGLLLRGGANPRRPKLVALAAAAAVIVVVVGPVGLKYAELQHHPEFRRAFESASGTHLTDFLGTGEHSYVLDHFPVIPRESLPTSRSIENRLFPGLVATGFGIAGFVLVVAEARRRRRQARESDRDLRVTELALMTLAGVAAVVLSLGDWVHVGTHRVFLPFEVFRHFVPGFAGIRAVSRLELAFQLALALLAAVGVDALLRRVAPRGRTVVAVGLAAVVVAECAMALIFVRVPNSADDGGVDLALRARPHGVVLELPIESNGMGVLWPTVEAPRQLLALRDHDPRVNGYSGFQPKGFDTQAAVLDHFPGPDALGLARRLGVRYVVLRTQLVGPVSPSTAVKGDETDGHGRYDPKSAAALVAALPKGVARSVVKLPGGYLIDLAGSSAG